MATRNDPWIIFAQVLLWLVGIDFYDDFTFEANYTFAVLGEMALCGKSRSSGL